MNDQPDLYRVAEFFAELGFGTDWGVGPPVAVPSGLRYPLAVAFVKQGMAESHDDALALLDAEFLWEST